MRDTYIDGRLCIFLVQMLKIVSISFINCTGQNTTLLDMVVFKFIVETIIHHYYCMLVKFDKQGCDFTICSGVGWNTFKVQYFSSWLGNTLLHLNWIPAFLKQPWSNTRSTLYIISQNNLETLEKLFSIIQSRCSICSHFLKSVHWNIHKFWHQVLIVMKVTAEDFKK